jgi:hypothetical protein
MRFKGTLVLLIVCLALGGYLYFYEIKGGEQREKAKQAESQVWKLEGKDIQQIDLVTAGRHIAAVRKGETEWDITMPQPLDADAEELNRLANSASNIQRDAVVDSNAADLAKFGLNPPKISLSLKTRNGKQHKIDFGSNNPTGSLTYAVLPGTKTVFLVTGSVASTFDKKLDDLRNHTVLSFEQPEAQILSITSSKGNLNLVKDGNDRWWIDGDHRVAADSPGIRGILNALSLGRIKEFLEGDPADYMSLGLDKPLADVSVTYGKDKAMKHLTIGLEKSRLRKKGGKQAAPEGATPGGDAADSSPAGIYLAKDASRNDLFFVEKDLVDKLLKSPEEVRDKALASFQRWDIDFIRLTNSKGTFAFTKSGGEWFLGEAKKKAKWDAVNGLLDALEKPVKEFLDKPAAPSAYGLDKPGIRVVLKQGGTVIVDCSLGKAAKNGIYAQVKGDPSVKVADPESLGKLGLDEPDLVEPAAAPPAKK